MEHEGFTESFALDILQNDDNGHSSPSLTLWKNLPCPVYMNISIHTATSCQHRMSSGRGHSIRGHHVMLVGARESGGALFAWGGRGPLPWQKRADIRVRWRGWQPDLGAIAALRAGVRREQRRWRGPLMPLHLTGCGRWSAFPGRGPQQRGPSRSSNPMAARSAHCTTAAAPMVWWSAAAADSLEAEATAFHCSRWSPVSREAARKIVGFRRNYLRRQRGRELRRLPQALVFAPAHANDDSQVDLALHHPTPF